MKGSACTTDGMKRVKIKFNVTTIFSPRNVSEILIICGRQANIGQTYAAPSKQLSSKLGVVQDTSHVAYNRWRFNGT